jgi:16S rRNA (uracil1498-N3)-methyltransferase
MMGAADLPPVTVLSGPEGGLSPAEETTALAAGFTPVTLGPRVLRAETAPLAVLAALTLNA